MPKILNEERVIEYSLEFKIRVVRLTLELDVQATEIAKVLMQSFGVRVEGQGESKDRMEVLPHNMQVKLFANGFVILLETRLPQSHRLTWR
jgi:hypothetical protein